MMPQRPIFIANEVRLKRTHHKGAFLLVEGRDDRLLLERFVDPSECKIQVAQGKRNVCEAVRELESGDVTGIVGIVDADFDRLEGRSPVSQNVLFNDFNDLESLLSG